MGFGFAGCVAGGGGYYEYDYYPSSHVYFNAHANTYYWNDSGRWRSGGHLPDSYHFRAEEQHEHLQSHSRQPWTEHHPDNDDHDHDHH
jgi:hypothetical protein